MSFWKKLFGNDDEGKEVSSETVPNIQPQREDENTVITLDDVGNFVAELQSYYANDYFKLQSEYISNSPTEAKASFLNKKMYFEKLAETKITTILNEIRRIESSTRGIWGKSIYSFYEELEKEQMENVYEQVFSLIIQLRAINVKKELDPIILSRLEKYRTSWNISNTIEIPENSAVNILSVDEEKESYQIGTHIVNFKVNNHVKRVLSQTENDKIANMKVELEFDDPGEFIMVRFANVDRKTMNRLSKTAILPDSCQFYEEPKIRFFVVKKNELNNFIKSVLQISLSFNQYFVITVMNMNSYVSNLLSDVVIKKDRIIEVKDSFTFIFNERSELYKDNLKVAYIKRKYIPEEMFFYNSNELRKMFN